MNAVLLDIDDNGEHWKWSNTLPFTTDSEEFDLDKEVEVTALNGRKKKYTYHFVGGKLILESKKVDPRDKNAKGEWQVEEGCSLLRWRPRRASRRRRSTSVSEPANSEPATVLHPY